VSVAAGTVAGRAASYPAGELGALYCGYLGPCTAPPEGWELGWGLAGAVGGFAGDAVITELKTIARVSATYSGSIFSTSFGTESFDHVLQATGLTENSIQWATGNADDDLRY
jgi:hypothetical protein